MYLLNRDMYACDFCGFEMKWDEHDPSHGTMYGCEICGREFCSKCFSDRYGKGLLYGMLRGSRNGPFEDDKLRCPKCYADEVERLNNKEKEG